MNVRNERKIVRIGGESGWIRYEKACAAAWLVCKGHVHPAFKGSTTGKKIDGKAYIVQVHPVDATGSAAKLDPDASEDFCFEITSPDGGDVVTMNALENEILTKLEAIDQEQIEFLQPRTSDIIE